MHARMSSERLPGKVLRDLAGRPLLGHLTDRLRSVASVDGFVLATSMSPTDDPIAAFADKEGLACYRGSLADVADRLLRAAEAHGFDAVVRINGDSPLMDPALVAKGVSLFREGGVDLVTNVFPRSFPKGQSVEVIATTLLTKIVAEASTEDREHVTQYIYRNPDLCRIRNFSADMPRAALQLSVDTIDDFHRIERIIVAGGGQSPQLTLSKVLEISDKLSEMADPL